MSDSVCAGQAFNGHGRGMCQWGTQRWATNQAKDWQWITNHYYNNNGLPSGARSGIIQGASPPAPDFSLSISPGSANVPRGGGTVNYTVSIGRAGGFADPVTLSITGLPSGATGTFAPNPAAGTASNLAVTVASSTPRGSYTFTVTGTGGTPTLTRTATAVLVKNKR